MRMRMRGGGGTASAYNFNVAPTGFHLFGNGWGGVKSAVWMPRSLSSDWGWSGGVGTVVARMYGQPDPEFRDGVMYSGA